MGNAYTLEEVEQEISQTYQWFHREAGVTVYPREEGHLGSLWALHDLLVEDRREVLTAEEFKAEHGRGTHAVD